MKTILLLPCIISLSHYQAQTVLATIMATWFNIGAERLTITMIIIIVMAIMTTVDEDRGPLLDDQTLCSRVGAALVSCPRPALLVSELSPLHLVFRHSATSSLFAQGNVST